MMPKSVDRIILQSGDGDKRHGTINGYSNLSCRCEACTEAWRLYHHQLRTKARLADELAAKLRELHEQDDLGRSLATLGFQRRYNALVAETGGGES